MTGWKSVVRGGAVVAAVAAVAVGAEPAQAEGTVFGGVFAGRDTTAYVGVSTPLPGARVGQGLALRAILSGSEYKYNAAVGRVRGKDVRADLSLLWQISDANIYFDVGAGARYVHTDLSPDDPFNPREGGAWEVVVSASGQQTFGPWRASEFGSYGFDGRDYYVRGDLTRTIVGPFRLGVEAQADGARDYSRQRYGAVLAVSTSHRWEVKLSAGASEESNRSGAYGGVSFQAAF